MVPQSERWRRKSAQLLERELIRNTFPSGINRELASDYQCFVAELGFLAAVEAGVSGHPLSTATWERLGAMADSAAALLDERLRPPRQGDSDEGCALLLDAPAANRWPSLLALADALIGRLDWWPQAASRRGQLDRRRPRRRQAPDRGQARPAAVTVRRRGNDAAAHHTGRTRSGAGVTAARTGTSASPRTPTQTPCPSRCVTRGMDILADPGTYCYHGERAWRSYFRSTIAHNTAELGGRSQSSEGGPFMWARHAQAREIEVIDDGDIARWTAEHDGYASLDPPALHRRSVLLDRASRSIDIIDEIEGGCHDVRLAFHLGPEVQVELDGVLCRPELATGSDAWGGAAGTAGRAPVEPAPGRDRPHPRLVFSRPGTPRCTAFTLVGSGRCAPGAPLATRLEFLEIGASSRPALSWCASDARVSKTPDIRAEAR